MPSSYTLTPKKGSVIFSVCDCNFTPGQIFSIPHLDPVANNRLASDNFRLQVLCFNEESQHGAEQPEHHTDGQILIVNLCRQEKAVWV